MPASRGPPIRRAAIRAVLFDLDGTLYDQSPLRRLMAMELLTLPLSGPASARRSGCGRCGVSQAQEQAAAARPGSPKAARRRSPQAAPSPRPRRRWRRGHRDCRSPRSPRSSTSGCSGARSSISAGAGWRARTRCCDLLRDRGVPGRVSCRTTRPRPKLRALGLDGRFSPVLCATDPEIGAFKPNPRGFLRACDAGACRRATCCSSAIAWTSTPPAPRPPACRASSSARAGGLARAVPRDCVFVASERLRRVLDDRRERRACAGVWPYVQIARVDHWFKNAFMLLGVVLAVFYEPAGRDLVEPACRSPSRVARDVPRRVEQLRAQRAARRAARPAAPGEAAPSGAVRAGSSRRWRTRSGWCSRRPASGWRCRSTSTSSRRRCWLWVMGIALQRAAAPHEGVAVPRRPQRVDQQPDPPAARLVRARHGPRAAALAGDLVLDDRRVLHGDEALRGVPAHRRPARGRGVPPVVRVLQRGAPARQPLLLRDDLRALRRHLHRPLSPRADSVRAVRRRAVRLLHAHRHAARQPGAEPREALPAARLLRVHGPVRRWSSCC